MIGVARALVLAPHTDDAEIGAGGLISRLVSMGTDVHSIAFSIADISVPAGYPKDVLAHEVKDAAEALGVPATNLHVLRYPVRRFSEHRQDILEEMVKLCKLIRPELVVVPCSTDVHQDHAVIHAEALRAYKTTTILGYELPWNTISVNTQATISLAPEHLETKIRAIGKYQSQQHRAYTDPEFIRGWARLRGVSIGVEYAESYEVIRWVVR